jgi:hypothetical protein
VTYNVDKPPADKSFNLVVKVVTADKNKVQAQSCVRYTGDGENSGMAILEFGLPSGFSLDDIEKVGFVWVLYSNTESISDDPYWTL